jgi:hypothetical protein
MHAIDTSLKLKLPGIGTSILVCIFFHLYPNTNFRFIEYYNTKSPNLTRVEIVRLVILPKFSITLFSGI